MDESPRKFEYGHVLREQALTRHVEGSSEKELRWPAAHCAFS